MNYDAIVIGIGAMGAATSAELARRGLRVLGLEQFDIPHERGSHHGRSRMIRMAYFEHPGYVTLLKRAYELWHRLESESGEKLLHITGGLYMGRPDSELVEGSLASAQLHSLPHEMLDPRKLGQRFPMFRLPGDFVGFFENQAGFLLPERCVAAYAQQARQGGADLRANEPVTRWSADRDGVTVSTARQSYRARRAIFCGGAWSQRLLSELGLPLQVTRQVLAWVQPKQPNLFTVGRLPVWAVDRNPREHYAGVHYGFPMAPGDPGFKLALHLPGSPTDPDNICRDVLPGDEETFRPFLQQVLPDADGPLLAHAACLYTNSPDSHFILDRHPQYDHVTFACGFSGHGFKFASVVGEVMADLSVKGTSDWPVDFLRLSRLA